MRAKRRVRNSRRRKKKVPKFHHNIAKVEEFLEQTEESLKSPPEDMSQRFASGTADSVGDLLDDGGSDGEIRICANMYMRKC